MKRKAWFSTAIIAALMMAFSAFTALADDPRYSEREIRAMARQRGYDYGMREGRYDRRNGMRFDYKNNRAYRDGMIGYRDVYHHDGNYRDGFREGFMRGYREGYEGYRNDRYNSGRSDDDRYNNGRSDDDRYNNGRFGRGRDNRNRPWWGNRDNRYDPDDDGYAGDSNRRRY